MNNKKRKLPSFRNDSAERKFWSRHSLEEFSDELEDLDVEIRPARTEQIALRLYKDDLESLKKLAKRRGVGHTTLARSIVERWLAATRETSSSGATPRFAPPPRSRSARKRNGVPILPKERRTRPVTPGVVNRLRDES